MCFSASASFLTSAVLLAGGTAAVKFSTVKRQLPLALIPLIFSIQQFSEGILWLSLTYPEFSAYKAASMFMFLIIAQVVWPAWVPFSIYLIETKKKRKKILAGLLIIGILVSAALGYGLLKFPVDAGIRNFHLGYFLDVPTQYRVIPGLLYFIPTVFPAFVSSVKYMKSFGIAILISFLVTKIFFPENVISVWCYFAAILTISVIVILKNQAKIPEKIPV